METLYAQTLFETGCALGEGPVWARGALAFVDIEGCAIHVGTLDRLRASRTFDSRPGAVFPRASGGWIGAIEGEGIVALDDELRPLQTLAHPEPGVSAHRFNDGAIDARGRLWIGTMHVDARSPTGALYRVDPDGRVTTHLEGLTISNGIGWSPDGATMYHIDSPTRRVTAYGFDEEHGTLSSARTRVTIDDGLPDGMCVDDDGGLWVARWGGARVTRFDPSTGEPTTEVRVPCANATACCFAGGSLVITTARDDTPRSGDVFIARTGRASVEERMFAG